MYQKEFAQRVMAKCDENGYSRLSVNVYYKAKCRLLESVSREAFYPIPKVDGTIIELIPREPPFSIENEDFFLKVVETLFGQRRKKIKNSLTNLVTDELEKSGTYSKSKLNEIIQGLPFTDCRVEKLSPESIAKLANNLHHVLYRQKSSIK